MSGQDWRTWTGSLAYGLGHQPRLPCCLPIHNPAQYSLGPCLACVWEANRWARSLPLPSPCQAISSPSPCQLRAGCWVARMQRQCPHATAVPAPAAFLPVWFQRSGEPPVSIFSQRCPCFHHATGAGRASSAAQNVAGRASEGEAKLYFSLDHDLR